MWTVFVVLLTLAARFTATDNEGEKVYLHQLTIYTTHEARVGFFRGTPEVYLSCDDGLPSVDLEQVTKKDELYTFEFGEQPTTQLGSDGCVTCRLKERDYFSSDDVFGEWKMCLDDFKETGIHEVVLQGEFKALFECPACLYVEPPLVPPTVQPSEPPEGEGPGAAAPSVEGSEVAVASLSSPGFRPGAHASSESASDSDYDDIIDEMIRIDMENLIDFYMESKAQ